MSCTISSLWLVLACASARVFISTSLMSPSAERTRKRRNRSVRSLLSTRSRLVIRLVAIQGTPTNVNELKSIGTERHPRAFKEEPHYPIYCANHRSYRPRRTRPVYSGWDGASGAHHRSRRPLLLLHLQRFRCQPWTPDSAGSNRYVLCCYLL